MSETFFIGDTHFGHKRILELEPTRPGKTIEEHNKELINRWNSKVSPKDTVFHLGDVLFGAETFDLLGELNGSKYLVLGNHDTYPIEKYLRYFVKVCGSRQYGKDIILTHIPIHPELFYRYTYNIHGHMHSVGLRDPRYINVSVEQSSGYPRTLDEIAEGRL